MVSIIKKKIIIVMMILSIAIVSVFIYPGKSNKKVNIYDTVKETFLTDKGYSNELSKRVSEDVFKHTNIYTVYNLNSPNYKKPFKIDFKLKEKSQSKKKNLIYVEMIYTVDITDSKRENIGGSSDIPITFIVKPINDHWFIMDMEVDA